MSAFTKHPLVKHEEHLSNKHSIELLLWEAYGKLIVLCEKEYSLLSDYKEIRDMLNGVEKILFK